MQISYAPVLGRKIPRFMGGSIWPRMEICGTSGLPILMVKRLHQSSGNIKRKIRAWRVQECITLVGADTVLTSAWPQSTPFHGGSILPRMEICITSGLPILMVTHLHQSNGFMKRKLRAWRVQKCITLVGADTVLTSAGLKSTPFHGDSIRPRMEICRTSGPSNSHGTAFPPKQW